MIAPFVPWLLVGAGAVGGIAALIAVRQRRRREELEQASTPVWRNALV